MLALVFLIAAMLCVWRFGVWLTGPVPSGTSALTHGVGSLLFELVAFGLVGVVLFACFGG